MKQILCSLAVVLLVSCGGGGGGGGNSEQGPTLQQELETIRARYDLPALTAMLVEGNRIVESGAVGIRAVGYPESVTKDDRWHIGSLTKSMTATLAARLVEKGLIGWDTTIASVYPGLVGVMQAAYEDVRLDELLSHTSGLSDDIATPIYGTLWTSADPLMVQRENWTAELLAVAPAVARGTYLYTNAGYIVAGAMLEKVTGMQWETLLQQEVFAPLGMNSTGFGAPGTAGLRDQPWGHVAQGGGWVPVDPGQLTADNPAALGPAGTVHTTLSDYLKYAVAHLEGANGTSTYLTTATFTKLHTPTAGTDYALGWGVVNRAWAGGDALWHNGSNTLWYAVVWLAPTRDLAVFAATNAAGASAGADATDEAAVLLLDRYFAR
jgi:CubicO group peptidase (beta-lactamase class C family)